MAAIFGPHPAPEAGFAVSREEPLTTTQKVARNIFIALAAVFAVGALVGLTVLCIPAILSALVALGIHSRAGSYSLPVISPGPAVYHAPAPVVYAPPPAVFAPAPRVVYASPAVPRHVAPPVVSGGRMAHAVPPADVRSTSTLPARGGHGGFMAVPRR